jgi:hypothetical protein
LEGRTILTKTDAVDRVEGLRVSYQGYNKSFRERKEVSRKGPAESDLTIVVKIKRVLMVSAGEGSLDKLAASVVSDSFLCSWRAGKYCLLFSEKMRAK